jgi:hypothetical protein
MALAKKIGLVLILLFAGCNNSNITGPVSGLYGTYKSTTFIEPGPSDAPVDLQARGEFLIISFKEHLKFSAEWFVPSSTSTDYYGSYTVKDSIIEFDSQNFNFGRLKWNKAVNQLETFDKVR